MNESRIQSDFRFEAEICEPKKLIPMLKAIHIMKTCVLTITRRGLRFTCQESSKTLQANSFIDRSLFVNFSMSSEDTPVTVCFRLVEIMNVLTLLGIGAQPADGLQPAHSLHFKYTAHNDKFCLVLREDSVKTKATIKTYDYEEVIMFQMMSACNKVILNAEPIIDFWRGADLLSEYIQVSIFGREPYLQWTTESERAKINHNIHRDSQDVEQFLHRIDVSNKYKLNLMKTSLRALIHTTKLSIRVDEEGLLSLQFMIKLDQNTEIEHCFVEYFFLPEVEPNSYDS